MRATTDDVSLAQLRRTAAAAPMLGAEVELEYLRRIQAHDDGRALRALLDAHLRLVVATAARFARSGVSVAELVAEGNLGLVEAARRFDAGKGTRFSTYAAWWVRARISRFAMGNRRIVAAPSTRNARKLLAGMRSVERALQQASGERPSREMIAAVTGTSAEDVAMVESALSARDVSVGPSDEDGSSVELGANDPSPEQAIAEAEECERRERVVALALAQLDRREREVVQRRILEDDAETLADIGRMLGLSRERVRQIEARAKRKLRAVLVAEVA
ncbi:sigma-70 family RNA polymerase sigma factor [Sandaracinus amylolyticus]|uniref:RNA polymerase sigma factor RpoH-related protein n=1 Tax=Sandaracinus amylolyticus TaxID=927083 RepID=A0A0F6YKL5_9BACT|nr:sigma-70 family RNA polymerase sigma factor [Sandaracinus amylolyticus]AKF08513.1 RNA polymerase sigma factor RpoH-related protein [Sandaracinus amylolyticus]